MDGAFNPLKAQVKPTARGGIPPNDVWDMLRETYEMSDCKEDTGKLVHNARPRFIPPTSRSAHGDPATLCTCGPGARTYYYA